MTPFTENEKLSALWQRLEPYLTQRVADLRSQNDGDLTHEQTIKLRGRISELKALLALANTTPAQAEDDA